MSLKRSVRELQRAARRLENEEPDDYEVLSSVVTVTEEDVTADGEAAVEPRASDGFELGERLQTGSDAVEAHVVIPQRGDSNA